MGDAHRQVRSLGVEAPLRPYHFAYDEGPPAPGQVRLDMLYSGFSAGTELTFLKGTNPYLHSRWDADAGVFDAGAPSATFPMPFLGYMESARVTESHAAGFAAGDLVAMSFAHKTGHTGDPARELMVRLPAGLDPVLGIFVAQMGPIAANGILHADAEMFGAGVQRLGAGVAGRSVIVWGGGAVGLLVALFARRGGAGRILIAEPSAFRRDIAAAMGFEALPEDEAWRHAKTFWHAPDGAHSVARGADLVFQTRARSESLHLALRALRPQGTVIDLAFYQDGLDGTRLGEEFHHNGLTLRCAQIGRVPRALAGAWHQRRLADETLALLAADGDAIRRHMVTHVVPFDDAIPFLADLVRQRTEFLQIVIRGVE